MRRTLNIHPQGPFAPPRMPTLEEQWAAQSRVFEMMHPRTTPPPKPYVHIPPGPTRDSGTKPLPTIAEAMAALSGRRGPG